MSQQSVSALSMQQVTFHYPKSSQATLSVSNWQVTAGQKVFVSGQSGSGKSTLLNLICGTLTPTTGDISLLGTDFSSLSSSKRDEFRARNIGVVFQQFNLIPYLSVKQNVQLAAYFGKGLTQEVDKALAHNMQLLQLPSNILAQRADQLSVGQQQRVAILRALINQPKIIIADEPTSALDRQAQSGFIELLLQCVEQTQATLLFVSHDLELANNFDQHIRMDELAGMEPQHVA